jgi:adenylosuccinate synthase
MSVIVVAGVNWGDEGKGRIVDYLSANADVIARYQGGNNAGHTVVNEFGTFKLHLIPSGIFNPSVVNILGPGMVIDLEGLNAEIEDLQSQGIDCSNILISDRATLCLPIHRMMDGWEEERLKDSAYGSTKRGIAPAYGDRVMKKSIQMGELLYPDHLKDRLKEIVSYKNLACKSLYGKHNPFDADELFDILMRNTEPIKDKIVNTSRCLEEAAAQGKTIIFETQLGALRDVCFGVYPFTSSSCSLASFSPIGSGLFGRSATRVIGVMKAFSTCVGAGPLVTELEEAPAASLREVAQEYGAATGRPRRIGHFDAVASRYGAYLQNATELALTKLDCLSGRPKLWICTQYTLNGKTLQDFPLNVVLENVKPVYEEMPGWTEDITGVRRFEDLPTASQNYVLEIEKMVGRPIRYISVGPERESLIEIAPQGK